LAPLVCDSPPLPHAARASAALAAKITRIELPPVCFSRGAKRF
jgi:hypothetical protein